MLKEKYEKAKNFMKEHKAEIIAGTICVGAAVVLGLKMKNSKELTSLNDNKLSLPIPEIPKVKIDDIDYIKHRVMDITDLEIRVDNICDIAKNSLNREAARITFEIAELENYITNLDHTKTINIFHRIPEKEKMINDLKTQLSEIDFDKGIIKQMMEEIWGTIED